MMIPEPRHKIKLGSLKKSTIVTNDSGRVLLTQLYRQLGLHQYLDQKLCRYKNQGYKPSGLLLDMMWLQSKGGDYVWDMREAGFKASASTYYRFLDLFRKYPQALDVLEGLQGRVVKQYYHNHTSKSVTLDQDATLIPCDKEQAAYCYKGHKAYHPMCIYDGDICVAHEFRSGEAAAQDIMPVFLKAYERLPKGVKVNYRGDSASYNQALIGFCDEHHISYAIGGRMCPEISMLIRQQKDWQELEPGLDYAELPHATTWSQDHHRFIVTRRQHSDGRQQAYEQQELDLFSNMMELNEHHYTLKLIVTNRSADLPSIIHWYHKRCGYGEHMHHELKADLAGGHLPSQQLEANAAWWHITVLAYNLQQFINQLAFNTRYRMKQIRHKLMVIPCRLVKHARYFTLQLPHQIYLLYDKVMRGIKLLDPG